MSDRIYRIDEDEVDDVIRFYELMEFESDFREIKCSNSSLIMLGLRNDSV